MLFQFDQIRTRQWDGTLKEVHVALESFVGNMDKKDKNNCVLVTTLANGKISSNGIMSVIKESGTSLFPYSFVDEDHLHDFALSSPGLQNECYICILPQLL